MHADLPRFMGSVEHALDDKGRLIVPARYRERLGPGFVLTIAQPDPCLALYPTASWAEVCRRLEQAPRKDESFRRFVRFLFAHSEEVTCDVQGRLVIPLALRIYAGIERDVVSIGSLSRIEIWAKERFAQHAAPNAGVGDFMAELGLY
ncbi:MAG: division/cell wall cluster transcriptional repressor MraZ [Candidatus Eremiobacteraeota bacterium]|nr:division/cell wall cluster transcriptional repressor MraZ [Candidatus Eremiobacteraeota bacterium]